MSRSLSLVMFGRPTSLLHHVEQLPQHNASDESGISKQSSTVAAAAAHENSRTTVMSELCKCLFPFCFPLTCSDDDDDDDKEENYSGKDTCCLSTNDKSCDDTTTIMTTTRTMSNSAAAPPASSIHDNHKHVDNEAAASTRSHPCLVSSRKLHSGRGKRSASSFDSFHHDLLDHHQQQQQQQPNRTTRNEDTSTSTGIKAGSTYAPPPSQRPSVDDSTALSVSSVDKNNWFATTTTTTGQEQQEECDTSLTTLSGGQEAAPSTGTTLMMVKTSTCCSLQRGDNSSVKNHDEEQQRQEQQTDASAVTIAKYNNGRDDNHINDDENASSLRVDDASSVRSPPTPVVVTAAIVQNATSTTSCTTRTPKTLPALTRMRRTSDGEFDKENSPFYCNSDDDVDNAVNTSGTSQSVVGESYYDESDRMQLFGNAWVSTNNDKDNEETASDDNDNHYRRHHHDGPTTAVLNKNDTSLNLCWQSSLMRRDDDNDMAFEMAATGDNSAWQSFTNSTRHDKGKDRELSNNTLMTITTSDALEPNVTDEGLVSNNPVLKPLSIDTKLAVDDDDGETKPISFASANAWKDHHADTKTNNDKATAALRVDIPGHESSGRSVDDLDSSVFSDHTLAWSFSSDEDALSEEGATAPSKHCNKEDEARLLPSAKNENVYSSSSSSSKVQRSKLRTKPRARKASREARNPASRKRWKRSGRSRREQPPPGVASPNSCFYNQEHVIVARSTLSSSRPASALSNERQPFQRARHHRSHGCSSRAAPPRLTSPNACFYNSQHIVRRIKQKPFSTAASAVPQRPNAPPSRGTRRGTAFYQALDD